MRPRRPRLDLPSMRATRSSGSSTYSWVRPSTNSPGWMTNGSPSADLDVLGEVRAAGRRGRSRRCGGCGRRGTSCPGAGRRWPAGPCASSHGSMRTRPSATRRRIVPSERTEVGGIGPKSASGRGPSALRVVGALGADDHRARARAGRAAPDRRAGRGADGAGRAARGWRGSCLVPPSPPLGSCSGSGSARMAHHTIHSSATIGILSANMSQRKPQRHVGDCTPAARPVHAPRVRRLPRGRRRARHRGAAARGARAGRREPARAARAWRSPASAGARAPSTRRSAPATSRRPAATGSEVGRAEPSRAARMPLQPRPGPRAGQQHGRARHLRGGHRGARAQLVAAAAARWRGSSSPGAARSTLRAPEAGRRREARRAGRTEVTATRLARRGRPGRWRPRRRRRACCRRRRRRGRWRSPAVGDRGGEVGPGLGPVSERLITRAPWATA